MDAGFNTRLTSSRQEGQDKHTAVVIVHRRTLLLYTSCDQLSMFYETSHVQLIQLRFLTRLIHFNDEPSVRVVMTPPKSTLCISSLPPVATALSVP